MKQEDKDLLLKDLCARLPYGVMISHRGLVRPLFNVSPTQHFQITLDNAIDGEHNGLVYVSLDNVADDVKPYLRPMSSMTEEERAELEHLSEGYFGKALDKQIQESLSSSNRNESEILEYIASSAIVDWLNAHHFDYRGLIEKGLALEAPEGMYD